MAKKRTKTRVTSKVDELPADIKLQVDSMIVDTSNTYQEISDFLKKEGFLISKSSIGRYAMRSNTAIQRLLEAQAQTEKLVNIVKQNPDADYSEAAMRMLMDGLINKMAVAEEEFDQMPLDKAGRLIASLSRTKVYKDRVRQDMKSKVELAFQGMEAEIMKLIKSDTTLSLQLTAILRKAKEMMVQDD
jgi:DNA-binding transcriptional regulator YhcF (GntR family)